MLQGDASEGVAAQWDQPGVIEALAALRWPGGRLCVEGWVADEQALRARLAAAGLEVGQWQELGAAPSGQWRRVRFAAQ